jgi:hypothetical protein
MVKKNKQTIKIKHKWGLFGVPVSCKTKIIET